MFFFWSSIQSGIMHYVYHVLVAFNLEQSLSLPLSFVTLTVVKSTGQENISQFGFVCFLMIKI